MKRFLITILSAMTLLTLASLESNASETYEKGHTTAYCLTGTTASGIQTQDGICAMNDKNLLGKYVVLYQRLPSGEVGDEIGTYLIADTGCKKNVIDVWVPDLKAVKEYAKLTWSDGCDGKVYYQIIEEPKEETYAYKSAKK